MIPEAAANAAAPWIVGFLGRRGLALRGDEAKVLAGYVLEAAAPHMLGRAITSAEELDALPKDTIVLDVYGVANQLSVEWITEGAPERTWNTTGNDCNTSVALPATVLWEPAP